MNISRKQIFKAKEVLLALPVNHLNEIAIPVFSNQHSNGHLLGVALVSKDKLDINADEQIVSATFVETNPDASFKAAKPQNRKFNTKDLLIPVILAKASFNKALKALPLNSVMKQQIASQKALSRDRKVRVSPSISFIKLPLKNWFAEK